MPYLMKFVYALMEALELVIYVHADEAWCNAINPEWIFSRELFFCLCWVLKDMPFCGRHDPILHTAVDWWKLQVFHFTGMLHIFDLV